MKLLNANKLKIENNRRKFYVKVKLAGNKEISYFVAKVQRYFSKEKLEIKFEKYPLIKAVHYKRFILN